MKKELLSDALSLLDDEYLTEAITYQPRKKNHQWMAWIAAAAACICLAVGLLPGEIDGPEVQDLPPILMVNGTLYYDSGIGRYVYSADGSSAVYINSPSTAYLPEGYEEYDAVTLVEGMPQADGETNVYAEGVIYTNSRTSDVVYVYTMVYNNATHTSMPHYVRFVSEKLWCHHEFVYWNGQDYRMDRQNTVAETLPKGSAELGVLHFVGRDTVPMRDLETNCTTYGEGRLSDGCSVYANPDDPDCIYVQVTLRRADGEYTAYLVCPSLAEK